MPKDADAVLTALCIMFAERLPVPGLSVGESADGIRRLIECGHLRIEQNGDEYSLVPLLDGKDAGVRIA